MTVGVVVDGGASLPQDLDHLALAQVPMGLVPLKTSAPGAAAPVSSAPSPGSFLEAISAADQGDGAVIVTVATSLSASYDAARLAASMSAGEHVVRLVDSATAACGEGLVALAAARAAALGASIDEVEVRALRAARAVRLMAVVGDVGRVARTGRLPEELWGSTPGSLCLVELVQGALGLLGELDGAHAAQDAIASAVAETCEEPGLLHVGALFGGDPGVAEDLLQAIAATAAPSSSFLAPLSPLMVAHAGSDLYGLAWWWERPAP
ncbi:MAG: DegV family protein [Acidimicrobiales bacterium]